MSAHDPHRPLLYAALADELRHARRLIEDLAEGLTGDPHFAALHLEKLQSFDLVAQYADETAALLDRLSAGQDSNAAIETVRLTTVQDRLRAALAQGG